MNVIDTSSIRVALKDQFAPARAKKAYTAGLAGGVAAVGAGFTLGGVFADGKIDGPEVVGIGTAFVGGFAAGFLGAWLPRQNTEAPRRQDALQYGDGLADPGNTAASAAPDEPKHRAES